MVIEWEKEQNITCKEKRNKQISHNKSNNKQQQTQLGKYITETFKILYIQLSNIIIEETLTNGYQIHNLSSINISTSGVLTH